MSKLFTCDCGYQWKQGFSGAHDCSPWYRGRIAALEKQNAELLAALNDIANPIATMQREVPEGYSFNGAMAIQVADNAQWYIVRAEKAISALQPSTQEVSK